MEAFESFVALALEAEGLVASEAVKSPVQLRSRRQAYEERQTHGFEVDLIGARADKLVLATVKSFLGSRGVVAEQVAGTSGCHRGIGDRARPARPRPDGKCTLPEVHAVGRPRPIRAAVEVALAGTVREAFVNAARHAPDADLGVVLTFRPDAVGVTVHNGIPSASPTTSNALGHGLIGMRERLALVGGHLTAGPDGSGWTVAAQVSEG